MTGIDQNRARHDWFLGDKMRILAYSGKSPKMLDVAKSRKGKTLMYRPSMLAFRLAVGWCTMLQSGPPS